MSALEEGLQELRAALQGRVLLPGDGQPFLDALRVWAVGSAYAAGPRPAPAVVVQPRGTGSLQCKHVAACCPRRHNRHIVALLCSLTCRHRRRGGCRQVGGGPRPAAGCEVRRPRQGCALAALSPASHAWACLASIVHSVVLHLSPSSPGVCPQEPDRLLLLAAAAGNPCWIEGGLLVDLCLMRRHGS